MQERVKNIIKAVAEEQGLPERVVEAIYLSQFRKARITIQEGEYGNPASFNTIRFINLGTLTTTEGRIKKMQEYGSKQ